MVNQQHFRIVGSGHTLPQRRLTAEDIDTRLGVELGWTRQQVGVETRYECVAPETMISMGLAAIKKAMANAKLDWSDIDYLIDCSTSQFRLIPCNAAHFQEAIGPAAASLPCMDVHSTCLGFILGLNVANGLFATSPIRNVVLVASESALGGVNWNEPESAALISDGAGAVVLQRREPVPTLFFKHETYAQHLPLCKVEAGGHHVPFYHYSNDRHSDYLFHMDGPSLFRVALKHLPPMAQSLIEQFETEPQAEKRSRDSLHIVPHQASPKACELVRRSLGFPTDRFHSQVQQLGNMAAASIPVMIDRLRKSQRLRQGDPVMLLGTSAGYSQAALIMEL